MRLTIVDCTLRDGGNYNSWAFPEAQVLRIVRALDAAHVDIVEVGYRGGSGSNKAVDVGVTAQCPADFLNRLPSLAHSQIAVQVVPTVCPLELLDDLADTPTQFVRVATYPHNFASALPALERLKQIGLDTSLNLMSASYIEPKDAAAMARRAEAAGADAFYMADSFGALTPDVVERLVTSVREATTLPIGYHGHNNLGLAFANALAAIRCGATWLDTSLCGLARGAGNLPTEQLVGAAQRWSLLEVDAQLKPTIAAAELVFAEILREPMRIAEAEIECGVFNLHYYFHRMVCERASAAGVDRQYVLAVLERLCPPSVDVSYVDKAIDELRVLDRSVVIRRSKLMDIA